MEKRPNDILRTVAGTSETSAFDETSPSGNDYLAEVCALDHELNLYILLILQNAKPLENLWFSSGISSWSAV